MESETSPSWIEISEIQDEIKKMQEKLKEIKNEKLF